MSKFRTEDEFIGNPSGPQSGPTWAEAERRAWETNTNGGHDAVDPLMKRDPGRQREPRAPFLDQPGSYGKETPVRPREYGAINDIPYDPELEGQIDFPANSPDPWDATDEPDAHSPLEMIQPDSMYGAEEEAIDADDLDQYLAAKSGSFDGSGIAPMSTATVNASRIAPLDNTGMGFALDESDIGSRQSFDGIEGYADQLIADARARHGRR